MGRITLQPHERIILSLDTNTLDGARKTIEQTHEHVGMIKIGLEMHGVMLAELSGSKGLRHVEAQIHTEEIFRLTDRRLMWDAKLNDIPNTVAAATRQLPSGAAFVTAHASCGLHGLKAIVEVAAQRRLGVLAVTVLTSLDEEQCLSVFHKKVAHQVRDLASIARDAGCAGVVCSPHEIHLVRPIIGDSGIIITPGIRPSYTLGTKDDQARVKTPRQAISDGADYLVIGRPILNAAGYGMTIPEAVSEITKEIAGPPLRVV